VLEERHRVIGPVVRPRNQTEHEARLL
jgi:hypothetical protein